MKRQLLTLTTLMTIATAVAAQDRNINPTVFILNDGAEQTLNFDLPNFNEAAKQAGAEVRAILSGSDSDIYARAQAAAGDGTKNILYLSTTNLPAKSSRELREPFKKLDEQIFGNANSKGWEVQMNLPMCRLYGRPPAEGENIAVGMLAVMDNLYAKLTCYRMTMNYYAGLPDENGQRVEPIYIDSHAVAMEAMMPAIEVHSAYLAHKDQRDSQGRYIRRESNVYAPNEEIFLRAYLDHVGRNQAGTMFGSYQIDLSLEVRSMDGEVLQAAPLHSYKGRSTLIYPMDETYFWNNITAGIALDEPGDYMVAFLFKDGSRPEMPPAEAAFPVTIAID